MSDADLKIKQANFEKAKKASEADPDNEDLKTALATATLVRDTAKAEASKNSDALKGAKKTLEPLEEKAQKDQATVTQKKNAAAEQKTIAEDKKT